MQSKRNAAHKSITTVHNIHIWRDLLLVYSIQLIKEVFHSGKDVHCNSSEEDHGRRCHRSRLDSSIAEVCCASAGADGFATVHLRCL